MKGNARYQGGAITAQGRPDFIIGRYVQVPEWQQEFYIAGVQHSFQAKGAPSPSWQSQLTVARGISI